MLCVEGVPCTPSTATAAPPLSRCTGFFALREPSSLLLPTRDGRAAHYLSYLTAPRQRARTVQGASTATASGSMSSHSSRTRCTCMCTCACACAYACACAWLDALSLQHRAPRPARSRGEPCRAYARCHHLALTPGREMYAPPEAAAHVCHFRYRWRHTFESRQRKGYLTNGTGLGGLSASHRKHKAWVVGQWRASLFHMWSPSCRGRCRQHLHLLRHVDELKGALYRRYAPREQALKPRWNQRRRTRRQRWRRSPPRSPSRP